MTSVYFINRTPSTVLAGVTPFERPRSCVPSYGHLWTFGCVCFVLLLSIERTKLSPRSAMCVLRGYSPEHKGYRCYDSVSRRPRISCYVTFLEDVPYYSSSSPDLHYSLHSFPTRRSSDLVAFLSSRVLTLLLKMGLLRGSIIIF